MKVGEFSGAVDEAFIEEVGAGLPDAIARSTELCFEGTDIAPEAAIFLTKLRELVLIICDSLRTQSGCRRWCMDKHLPCDILPVWRWASSLETGAALALCRPERWARNARRHLR